MRNGCRIGRDLRFPVLLAAFLSATTSRGQDEAAAFVHNFQHDPVEEGLV